MREYASSTGNEYAEQSKFELGEMNFILALEHNAACLVNSYVTECKYGLRQPSPAARRKCARTRASNSIMLKGLEM